MDQTMRPDRLTERHRAALRRVLFATEDVKPGLQRSVLHFGLGWLLVLMAAVLLGALTCGCAVAPGVRIPVADVETWTGIVQRALAIADADHNGQIEGFEVYAFSTSLAAEAATWVAQHAEGEPALRRAIGDDALDGVLREVAARAREAHGR